MHDIDDLRIRALRPLLPPAILIEEIPATEEVTDFVAARREAAAAIVQGRNERLMVVVGPCSVHDVKAAREYAEHLLAAAGRHAGELLIIMRVYFEKPRTVVGWKGLINDPFIDGSFQINEGLRLARGLLLDLARMGLAAGTEFLDTITPQFIADLVSWAAIGARTTESQVHRELASGLSMPVGFKNGTDGNAGLAVDAVRAARVPHWFPSVTKQGVSAIFNTTGNEDCHVILRGGQHGPNYDEASVLDVASRLREAGQGPRLMIDCSHANSGKDYRRQPLVAREVARQVAGGSRAICGVMLESHLVAGRQLHEPGVEPVYGQSITDACLGIEDTLPVLDELAEAVQRRREAS